MDAAQLERLKSDLELVPEGKRVDIEARHLRWLLLDREELVARLG